jgi:hypothetical protein
MPSFKKKFYKKNLRTRRTFLFSSTIYTRHTLLLFKSNSRKLQLLVVHVKVELKTAFMILVGKSTNEKEILGFC